MLYCYPVEMSYKMWFMWILLAAIDIYFALVIFIGYQIHNRIINDMKRDHEFHLACLFSLMETSIELLKDSKATDTLTHVEALKNNIPKRKPM
jgi:hypothetical protein